MCIIYGLMTQTELSIVKSCNIFVIILLVGSVGRTGWLVVAFYTGMNYDYYF